MLKSSKKCKAVIFSDIHYASEKPVNNGSLIDRKLTHHAVPLVNKLIEKINETKPDIAINLGDSIEDSGDHDTDIKDFSIIWNLLKGIKAPFYSLIGNHDLRSMSSRKEIEQVMGYENATFSIDLDGYHFVFLAPEVDSQIGTKEGGIFRTQFFPNKDLEWLKRDLQENALPCVVFSHFGIAEDEMKGNWWFERCPGRAVWANSGEIRGILEKDGNVAAVFCGHQHWTKHLKKEGVDYYVVGSLTEDINGDGIPDGVYFEVDFDGGGLRVTEHHIRL